MGYLPVPRRRAANSFSRESGNYAIALVTAPAHTVTGSLIATDPSQSRPVAQDAGLMGTSWPIRNTRECRQRAATAAPPGPVAMRNVGKHVN